VPKSAGERVNATTENWGQFRRASAAVSAVTSKFRLRVLTSESEPQPDAMLYGCGRIG
jgi:hypothetical protein